MKTKTRRTSPIDQPTPTPTPETDKMKSDKKSIFHFAEINDPSKSIHISLKFDGFQWFKSIHNNWELRSNVTIAIKTQFPVIIVLSIQKEFIQDCARTLKVSLITVTWTLNNSIVNQIISYQYPSVDHHAVAGYLMWRIKKMYELNDILLYSSVEKRIPWWSLSWCSVLLSFWCVLFAFFLVECAHIEYVHNILFCGCSRES